MNKKRVYDLPTRIFHWLFALFFIAAFIIGNTVDDDSRLFSYHMLAGLVLCFLVVLRIGWGLIGTKHARFSGFSLNSKELVQYFKGVLSGDSRKWAGHNPASSWAAIVMMLLAVGLGISGYLMSSGQGSHDIKEVHELLANSFLVVVLLHLAGVALHSLRHRDSLWKSMLDGKKSEVSMSSSSIPSYSRIGVLLLVATIGFSTYLAQNFDSRTRNLSFLGTKLHLGEQEDEEHEEREHHRKSHSKRHHDD